jgi:hypothetical protein
MRSPAQTATSLVPAPGTTEAVETRVHLPIYRACVRDRREGTSRHVDRPGSELSVAWNRDSASELRLSPVKE